MLYPTSDSVFRWESEGWHCGWGAGKRNVWSVQSLRECFVHSSKTGSTYISGCVINGVIARAAT